MLVLTRQREESITIGDNIVITVVEIRGDKVRLGIQAPREIPVHRTEVYNAIQLEQRRQAAERDKPSRGTTAPPRTGESAPSLPRDDDPNQRLVMMLRAAHR